MARGAIWAVAAALAVAMTACGEPAALRPGLEGCLLPACHARVEQIHYGGDPVSCVDCHGGDPHATTKEAAHPTTTVSFNEATPGVHGPGGRLLAGASLRELDELDPKIMQFLNPADYRVADQTCGSTTLGRGGNCHTSITEKSKLSTHATLAGQLAGGLYFGGVADKTARWAVRAVVDPFPLSSLGFAATLASLPDDVSQMPAGGAVERAHFASYGQLCIECHLSANGANVPGKYTSSGCNACHLLTDTQSRPRTTDLTQDHEETGHGALHRFTNLIPDAQCNHCHHAHLHRGLLAQGVRERSEPEGDAAIGGSNRGVEDPPNAVFWSTDHYVRYQGAYNLYGKPYPFYIEDEDGTNDVDETPPDIHTEKGMACIDCHTMRELHGSKHMATRRSFETQVRCETCHGTPSTPIDIFDTPLQIARSRIGGNLDNKNPLTRDDDGAIQQLGKLDQREHPVTQISERTDPSNPRYNPRVLLGCGLHAGSAEFRAALLARVDATAPGDRDETFPGMPAGAELPRDIGARRGRLECFACHNAWTPNCYGCHVYRDDRVMAVNKMTGRSQPGKVSTFAMSVIADGLSLGLNDRGRISPMIGTAIFVTHIGADGSTIVDAQPLRTVDGFEGDGNEHNPVHHHTVRRQPRDCQGCHPRADGVPDDDVALARAVGFGTGEFLFQDGDGNQHVLDRTVAIDIDGDGTFEDPRTTRLPYGGSVAEVQPVAGTTHVTTREDAAASGPGPLDRDAINRMLGNSVVPQRAPSR